jgi:hypothetical protein
MQKVVSRDAVPEEADLVASFWQRVSELGARDEQQRLAAIEQGLSSSWLVALRHTICT